MREPLSLHWCFFDFKRWRTLPGSPADYDYSDIAFSALDLSDAASITNAIADCDLVVHTAGPFQRKSRPEVLEAAIRAKVSKRRSEVLVKHGCPLR